VANSYGFLGTYPPTQCGIATFSRALLRSLVASKSGDRAGVVRVLDGPAGLDPSEVVGHLVVGSADSHLSAAKALNDFDVAVVQHEYGIYGGQDGEQLLDVLDHVRVPVVVVAHTVLARPTAHQAEVLHRIVEAADGIVVMTETARDRLLERYSADPGRVTVIKHGANVLPSTATPEPGTRPTILTWGLLGPGKGIEWAIDGLQRLTKMRPVPQYVVAGQTHPRVLQLQGERYRRQLTARAAASGVSHMLRFEDSYLDDDALAELIQSADVVLLPYDAREQVTSGVLVEAVAAGKPVVATAFPHAVELLSGGAGLLVPQFDGVAIGEALHTVLTRPVRAQRMQAAAARLAPAMRWPSVAQQYRMLATDLLTNRMPVLG
jgi:polysaccharide biosynthesis protein PslF